MLPRCKVLIVSWLKWPTSARLALAMSEAGAEVEVLCPPAHPLLSLKGLGRRHAYGLRGGARSLARAVKRGAPDFVIPCDDVALAHVRALDEKCFTASCDPLLLSRAGLIALAQAEGVRAPRTALTLDEAAIANWFEAESGPAFLKLDGAFGGAGVVKVNRADEALEAFRQLSGRPTWASIAKEAVRHWTFSGALRRLGLSDPKVSIQAAIEGRPANCCFAAWRGEVLAMSAVEALQTAPHYGVATLVQPIESPQMRHAAERIAARLSLTGFFGLDFILDRVGEAWLIELNARPTPISHLNLGPGRDPVSALVGQIAGCPAPVRPALPPGVAIGLFPHILEPDFPSEGVFQDHPVGQPGLAKAFAAYARAPKRAAWPALELPLPSAQPV